MNDSFVPLRLRNRGRQTRRYTPVTDPRDSQFRSALIALALISQVGLAVVVPTVCGVLAGAYVDKLLDSKGIVTVVMTIAGIGSGLYAAYKILSKEIPWNH